MRRFEGDINTISQEYANAYYAGIFDEKVNECADSDDKGDYCECRDTGFEGCDMIYCCYHDRDKYIRIQIHRECTKVRDRLERTLSRVIGIAGQ